jgi:hypothetical protein
MNDDQVMTAVRESFEGVRMDRPLADTVRRGRTLRARRRAGRAAGVAGVAVIAGVTAVAITGLGRPAPVYTEPVYGNPTPGATAAGGARLDAWTVTKGTNGEVYVTIRQLRDAAGLQRALRADGVPARVAFSAGIPSDSPPLPAGCANVTMPLQQNVDLQAKILDMTPMNPQAGIALGLYASEIPNGIGIYLAVRPPVRESNGSVDWSWGLDLVQATPGCTG